MKEQYAPRADVNSDAFVVVRWHVVDGAGVAIGDLIADVETEKSDIEVFADAAGYLIHRLVEGERASLATPLALIVANAGEVEGARLASSTAPGGPALNGPPGAAGPSGPDNVVATVGARERAAEAGVDLAAVPAQGMVTAADVDAFVAGLTRRSSGALEPLPTAPGQTRLLLIGGGLGATQVTEILRSDQRVTAVGILDDDEAMWGEVRHGLPVLGGSTRLAELVDRSTVDAAIVTVSTSVQARVRLREVVQATGLPLANAIDPSCRIAADAVIGTGNVLCAFCHLGAGVVLGSNNFLSAYNSFDHHCEVGSDISTGPTVVASGLVKVGSRVRIGTGVFLQPHVEIGDDVLIASGAVLTQSVPAAHTVRVAASNYRIAANRPPT